MSEVRRHRQFDEWMDAIVDPDSGEYLGEESLSIRQGIENLITVLETLGDLLQCAGERVVPPCPWPAHTLLRCSLIDFPLTAGTGSL